MIISEQQREDHFREYLRLLKDPDYVDVTFDEQSGGVSAVHREHRFDSQIGAFRIRKGDYERISVERLRRRGHLVILGSEVAPDGVKTSDGILDGAVMEIKSVEGKGKWAIKDKLHYAAKQGAECIVFYFHDDSLFSMQRIEDGLIKYGRDPSSNCYRQKIKRVLCIVQEQILEMRIPQ